MFPVFASYKALKANDPAQLTPWLMYWVVVACVLVVESWVGWVVSWYEATSPNCGDVELTRVYGR